MRRVALLAIALAFTACQDSPTTVVDDMSPQFAATVTTSNEVIPLSLSVWIDCAEEYVLLEGELHIFSMLMTNDNRFTLKQIFNPQGIFGYGEISGLKYQGTGNTQDMTSGSYVNGSYSDTYMNNFRIIGQGPGNNYLAHMVYHITVNADGTVTTEVNIDSMECM